MFSQVSGSYQQYTIDYSEKFLKQLCKNSHAPNQIAIHRDGNLIYYAYARKKSDAEIYGICVVCGEICLDIQWLYGFFQRTLDAAAIKGILFRYDEHGEICKNVDSFSSEAAEVDSIFREIKAAADKKKTCWDVLPPEDFSISKDCKISLSFSEDGNAKITDAVRHYNNIIITMDNIVPSSFAKTVERLNSEKAKLQDDKEELEAEIKALSKQKKQYRWVAFLSVAVVLSLIVLYFLNDNLSSIISNQDSIIKELEDTLSKEKITVEEKNIQISELSSELNSYKDSLRYSNSRLVSLKKTFPINITKVEIGNTYDDGRIETDYGNTIFSSYTMYLTPKITYTGINTGQSVNLKIKWYKPNGTISAGSSSPNGFSQLESVYVYGGSNTEVLHGWGNNTKGFWDKGTYRMEIWYEDVCLKAKTFTIY